MASKFDAHRSGDAASNASALQVAIREFLREPRLVGSAFPASGVLVDRLLAPVDWSKARVVVEYGPGSGPLTRAMLSRMPRDSRLVAIDVSRDFTRHLRRTIDDPRLLAITDSAASVAAILADHRLGSADVIVTGIPFSTIPARTGSHILDLSAKVLADDGAVLAYQMRRAIAPMLKQRFAEVEKSFVWRNIPPCHLYWARRPLPLKQPLDRKHAP
ncbi:class I SAM-dependent methyltransferase [Blastomonas sp.]|uniref:class I SAM-dependent methyltransferase n=1 Tax=Blastomonas sp. TaxID=1909299 RepID=UPI00391BE4D9